jgi:MoaA/NifB/PqqE/SkfB family radical SAM enzyme
VCIFTVKVFPVRELLKSNKYSKNLTLVDTIRTIKLISKWGTNLALGRRRPVVAVFSMTHYCNFYCPMCPFGDPEKEGQIALAKRSDLSTQQWKMVFDKVSKYCIWCIIEGGEPTSRPDFMELVEHLHKIKMPITLITNCSLLHKIDLHSLKKYVEFVTCSIDSTYEESYCKVRGVSPQVFKRVMDNLRLLTEHEIPHYFNSVITKFNAQEFIDQTYFEKAKALGASAISLTFVEDRSDVEYSLLPDRQTMIEVCKSVLDYMRKPNSLKMLIPPEYFQQIIDHGRTVFDECGVWKSVFINANGTVMVPCWKFNSSENTYSLLDNSIEEIWNAPQWDIARTCHDCKVLGCIWTSSQPLKTLARSYMRGLPKMIRERRPDLNEITSEM